MVVPALSCELVGVVLRHLQPESDSDALKACSLVCSTFARESQPLLFDDVKLRKAKHLYNGGQDAVHFASVLSIAPHLAHYVRSIYIDGNSVNQPSFCSVLRQLPNIRRLVLHFLKGQVEDMPHSRVSDEISSAVSEALHNPSLNAVGFHRGMSSVRIPLGWVFIPQNLHHLELSNVTFSVEDEGNIPRNFTPVSLQSLTLWHLLPPSSMDETLSLLFTCESPKYLLRSLTKMELATGRQEDFDAIPRLLQLCSDSLVYLNLNFRNMFIDFSECNLSCLHSLRELGLAFPFSNSANIDTATLLPKTMDCVTQIVRTVNTSSIRRVHLCGAMAEPFMPTNFKWFELDEYLAIECPSETMVLFELVFSQNLQALLESRRPFLVQELNEAVSLALPKLDASERLSVQCRQKDTSWFRAVNPEP